MTPRPAHKAEPVIIHSHAEDEYHDRQPHPHEDKDEPEKVQRKKSTPATTGEHPVFVHVVANPPNVDDRNTNHKRYEDQPEEERADEAVFDGDACNTADRILPYRGAPWHLFR
mmetsp:Transcript_20537/g.59571  ORF Transcript_20537/g.59571 Transcript_20537/m.59571 type:complete len:113 (-) Transcript_20537:611-949(-)